MIHIIILRMTAKKEDKVSHRLAVIRCCGAPGLDRGIPHHAAFLGGISWRTVDKYDKFNDQLF